MCRGLGAIIAIAITAFSAAIAACLALMDVIETAAVLVGDKVCVHVVKCRRQFKCQLLVTLTGVGGTVRGVVRVTINVLGDGIPADLVWG